MSKMMKQIKYLLPLFLVSPSSSTCASPSVLPSLSSNSTYIQCSGSKYILHPIAELNNKTLQP